MNLIACVDLNLGIGFEGKLLYSIPDDLRRFKRLTEGKTVVMGSGTLRSLPGGKPLPNRENIILSRSMTGGNVCGSVSELLEKIAAHNPDDVFVIGGEAVYAELEKFCSKAYVTRVNAAVSKRADKFFPDLAKLGWELIERSPEYEREGIRYAYEEYARSSE